MGAASMETASRCSTEKEKGAHVFEISGYSLKKGMGVGKFVQSATFTVGGYDWSIRVYPDGLTAVTKEDVAFSLQFMSSNAEARAFYDLRLEPIVFNSRDVHLGRSRTRAVGCVPRSDLETSKYLDDDRLVVRCLVIVIKESLLTKTRVVCSEIDVPPSDITEHLAKLLEAKEQTDVTFCVGGETFEAHKILLAMRSPVFKAELYGQMKETNMQAVTIEDMQPAVFKALLHFIYTDSLPGLDDLEGDDKLEMIRHLLVAADRYAMDRLKLVCQSILGKNLDVENVSTTLALADQHNCDKLKDVCIEFIDSSDKMDAVVATQDYANLKRSCPSVLVDVLEKTSRFRKA
ncbi:hypothetical protein BRADI_3g18256v3 [Brachypodium distachyon]|uniref:BTB domain-containing protein n=1 Tax=Brachypodium distachyon TaxID=15368 RepID=A0A0Q3JBE4_BRADI|nr:hypothetical protein BRADI_3g18248v3 [Brachypodium distachyon]PNT66901.1 hypothetical protein BRADI_3g18256v3 [Brachypodium distachyon]